MVLFTEAGSYRRALLLDDGSLVGNCLGCSNAPDELLYCSDTDISVRRRPRRSAGTMLGVEPTRGHDAYRSRVRAQGASLGCVGEAVPRYRYPTWRELGTANSLLKQGMNVIATFQAADHWSLVWGVWHRTALNLRRTADSRSEVPTLRELNL